MEFTIQSYIFETSLVTRAMLLDEIHGGVCLEEPNVSSQR